MRRPLGPSVRGIPRWPARPVFQPGLRPDVRGRPRRYRTVRRFGPQGVVYVHHPRIIPPAVVDLGQLVGLIYRSGNWQPGRPQTYIHFMQNPPRLVSSPDGRQLYIVGGRYQVTPRGIEG